MSTNGDMKHSQKKGDGLPLGILKTAEKLMIKTKSASVSGLGREGDSRADCKHESTVNLVWKLPQRRQLLSSVLSL